MDNAAEPNAIDNPENPSSEQQAEEGQTIEGQALEGLAGHDHAHGEHNHAHGEPGHTHAEGPPPMDPACKREISVEIPAEVVAKQQEALVQQYSKQARIPGFRKGKVPASMVRSRFSSEITSDVVEHLVPQYFREAVVKGGYRPVSQPHIYGLEFTPGEPIKFKAAFEVLPEFELGDYKQIKVEKPDITVTDEQINNELKLLQEKQASFDPVDDERGAEKGEFVQVSFEARPQGLEDGPEAEGAAAEGAAGKESSAAANPEKPEDAPQPVQMEEVLVEIGGANTIPEFTEHLAGAKAGEERSFAVSYPEDFYDKRLAGMIFDYKVKVNAIKKKTLPELNDDFAKELSPDFQNLGDLKQRFRENMEAELKHKTEHEAKDKLIEELLAKHDFPVPRSMVEHQIDLRLERGLRALAAQGMKTEDMRRMDFGRLRAGQQELAVKEVKSSVLLAKIAIKENIQVTDEELDREIEAMAAQMQQPLEEVKKRLKEDNAVERLRDRMRSEKALNLLYSNSN
ncbi:MAG TPA: trigger factor [Candidatus Dormibacteraeota bacterium]|nr:trigger factor [Candidatus Dormibacteraeota bacterium]